MALAVEWLPEEWPDGIPNLKQLLVVAPLTPRILLLFATGITSAFAPGQFSTQLDLASFRRAKVTSLARSRLFSFNDKYGSVWPLATRPRSRSFQSDLPGPAAKRILVSRLQPIKLRPNISTS